jgi:Gas vesicle synthesis protein GvpL/GvpF
VGSAAGETAVDRNGLGWYVYGVVGAREAPDELVAGTAVDPSHRVILLREGPMAALASNVSMKEFTEANVRETLSDPAWLEPKIRAHEQVLEAALAVTSVVPFRFCTLFGSEGELRRFLGDRAPELSKALRHVEGSVEIGVKGFVARDRLAEALARRDDAIRHVRERLESAKGGREYLERRRLEQLVAEATEQFKAKSARELHARLRAVAEDGVLNPVQSREVTARDDDMFMNAAYLVRRGRELEAEVAALAADYAELGVSLELTGPWPPYNFVPQVLGES